jgi:hypothetical protein
VATTHPVGRHRRRGRLTLAKLPRIPLLIAGSLAFLASFLPPLAIAGTPWPDPVGGGPDCSVNDSARMCRVPETLTETVTDATTTTTTATATATTTATTTTTTTTTATASLTTEATATTTATVTSEPQPSPAQNTPAAGPTAVFDAPVAIPRDCSTPVDQALNTWLASVPDHATARLAATACYALDDEIILDHRVGLTLDGNGATLRTVTTGGGDRSNIEVRGGSEVTVTNIGLVGDLKTLPPDPEAHVPELEWQHGLDFSGTQGGVADDVTVDMVRGDCFEADFDGDITRPSRDIVVRNSHCRGAGRMGIGLTDVDGFTVEDTYIGQISWSAIDLETDDPRELGREIVVRRVTFENVWHHLFANAGPGGYPNVGDVLIEDSRQQGSWQSCNTPVLIATPAGMSRHNYVIRNNRFMPRETSLSATGVTDLTYRGNVSDDLPGGCSQLAGAELHDVQGAQIADNDFGDQILTAVLADAASSGVVSIGNVP